MFDCSEDVLAYHDEKVTLPTPEQTRMRGRRDANRVRVKAGLRDNQRPQPSFFKSQGSYAMRTMTQHPDNAYDIDDGVYFKKSDLVGPRGGDMSALEARQMVRDTVDDGSFNKPPTVEPNCVRVHYEGGYHVDLPVYRLLTVKDVWGKDVEIAELASSDWKRSDARNVTGWFTDENEKQSPDLKNGGQLRRITRLVKKYARSRPSWEARILSGFGITKLVTERYQPDGDREDRAFYNTIRAMRDRLLQSLSVSHPVTPDETITDGINDPRARFLREKLDDALEMLAPLSAADCTRETALKCWDSVFYTDYFISRRDSSSNVGSNASGWSVSQAVAAARGSSEPPQTRVGFGRWT